MMTEPTLEPLVVAFFVEGIPRPGGSKRGFIIRSGGKPDRIAMTDASGVAGKNWRQDVRAAAIIAMARRRILTGPLEAQITFNMPRPKGHYGTGKNASRLKDSAPTAPTTRPDLDKLSRSVLDALKGIVWPDDSVVVRKLVQKDYALPPMGSGAYISVRQLDGGVR
jgi:Holliday junction resolvase RusA-like endonuclease